MNRQPTRPNNRGFPFAIFRLLLVFLWAGALRVAAESSVPETDEPGLVSVEWLFAASRFDDEGRLEGGLLIRLEPGWHLYGPAPGDLGAPPRIRFSLPEGVSAGYARYPPAMSFVEPAGVSHGYESAVLIRYALLRPPGNDAALPETPMTIDLEIMMCREICVAPFRTLRVPWPADEDATALASRWRDALRTGGWNLSASDAAIAAPGKSKQPSAGNNGE